MSVILWVVKPKNPRRGSLVNVIGVEQRLREGHNIAMVYVVKQPKSFSGDSGSAPPFHFSLSGMTGFLEVYGGQNFI